MAKNVLIVDEPATMRQILMRGSRAGIDVADPPAASGGGEGTRVVAAATFDLILGDVDLPNRNGPVRC
jgi:hypothetical protein